MKKRPNTYLVPVEEFQEIPSRQYDGVGIAVNANSIYVVHAYNPLEAKNNLRKHPLYWQNQGKNPLGNFCFLPFFKFGLEETIQNNNYFEMGSHQGERLESTPY